jgi:hypothetical protein
MKVEGLLFAGLAAFLLVVTVVYAVLSEEWVGVTCLALSGGLALIIGYYLLFTARRMDLRPEDRPDAEISEGSGEVGFFAPHSWWPIATAAGFTITTLGLVFGPFLALIGLVAVLVAVSGFLFEFYVGVNRAQGFTVGELDAMGEAPTTSRKFLGS